jgi:hypothetical protein
MSTTHIGKIGRLPQEIRQLLGQRIEDGIPGTELVQWLNGMPEVQEALRLRFEGRAITEQNLSEWKQTGHEEWVRREERRALAERLLEQQEDETLEPEAAMTELSDRLGRELGMEMARVALALAEPSGSPEEQWKRLSMVYREVSLMRRDDHRAERARIQRERWEREREREEEAAAERERKEFQRKALEVIHRPAMVALQAELFGGGKYGATQAELVERIKADEDPEQIMAWYEAAQKEWDKEPAEPEGEGQANDEARMTNGSGGGEASAAPVADDEDQVTLCGVNQTSPPEFQRSPGAGRCTGKPSEVAKRRGNPGESK